MSTRWKLYSLAGGALAAEDAAVGATADETSRPLPRDDHTPRPRMQSTRAVTIDAPPEQVWPWLNAYGHRPAGFYTHDWSNG